MRARYPPSVSFFFLACFQPPPPLSLSLDLLQQSAAILHSVDDAPSQRFLRPADFSYHRHRFSWLNGNDDDEDDIVVAGHIRDAEDSPSHSQYPRDQGCVPVTLSFPSKTDHDNETVFPSSSPRSLAWASLPRHFAQPDRYSQLARVVNFRSPGRTTRTR